MRADIKYPPEHQRSTTVGVSAGSIKEVSKHYRVRRRSTTVEVLVGSTKGSIRYLEVRRRSTTVEVSVGSTKGSIRHLRVCRRSAMVSNLKAGTERVSGGSTRVGMREQQEWEEDSEADIRLGLRSRPAFLHDELGPLPRCHRARIGVIRLRLCRAMR
jgi:hypothetical protein